MTTLDQFINQHNNQPLEVEDASAPDQCMDLAFGWCDAIGLDRASIRNGAAKDVWTNHSNVTPVSTPQAGDFVIWGTKVGAYGHIAVFITGDANNFTSFDQNWNGIQKCLKVNHNNYGVLGFLRPQGEIMASPSAADVTNQFNTFQGSPPTQDQINYYTARDWGTLNGDLLQEVFNELQTFKQDGAVLAPGKYIVK